MQELVREWEALFNAGINVFRFEHYCHVVGCCSGHQLGVCIGRMVSVLARTIFLSLGSDLPSITRWYTTLPHLCKQTLGCVTHAVLPRVAELAYTSEATADADEDSYHGAVNKKKVTSLTHLSGGPETAKTMLLTAAYVQPVDRLSNIVQKADFAAGALHQDVDFVGAGVALLCDSRHDSLLSQTQLMLCDIWSYWEAPAGSRNIIRSLLWYLEGSAISRSEVLDDSRRLAKSFGAELFVLELKYQRGFFRWLGAAYLDQEEQAQVELEFYNSHLCDREELMSKALLSKLRSCDDLRSRDLLSLREELKNRLRATNMALEGELAEVRAALPRGKFSNAELQCYLPHIDRLLKQHVARGNLDPRAPENAEHRIASGVPLERHPAASWARPDRRRMNLEGNPNPNARPRSCDSDDLQDVSTVHAEGVVQDDSVPEADEPDAQEVDMFIPGDSVLPVRPEIVAGFLRDNATRGIRTAGVANKASEVRRKFVQSLLVRDGQATESLKLEVRLCCHELHPGLCATVDAEHYANALLLPKSMERCIGKELVHKFIVLKEPELNRGNVFYVARRRQRKTSVQTTHVLNPYRRNVDGKYSSAMRPGRGWHFVTLWSIAKAVLKSAWAHIMVHEVRWENLDDGRVDILATAVSTWEVWPTLYKRPRLAPIDGPRLDDPERKPKAKTAGVKIVGPTAQAFFSRREESASSEEESLSSGDEGPVPDPAIRVLPVPETPAPRLPAPETPAPEPQAAEEAVVEAAPQLPRALVRARPGDNAFKWGRFSIARVNNFGVQIGWGLTCGKHLDVGESGTPCKIQMTYGQRGLFSDDDIILRLKRWAHVATNKPTKTLFFFKVMAGRCLNSVLGQQWYRSKIDFGQNGLFGPSVSVDLYYWQLVGGAVWAMVWHALAKTMSMARAWPTPCPRQRHG